jgi:TonB family protein
MKRFGTVTLMLFAFVVVLAATYSCTGPRSTLVDSDENEAVAAEPNVPKPPTAGVTRTLSSPVMRNYYDRLYAQIRAAWVLPESIGEMSQEFKTVVAIKITPSGAIEESWIEKGSGNNDYDKAALQAVRKASPLPPLPVEMGKKSLKVGINFKRNE